MLGQSTLISYHTEANGYIFFAAGVGGQPNVYVNIVNPLFLFTAYVHPRQKRYSHLPLYDMK